MPHRALTPIEMAAAQKLFDQIMSPEFGGPSPDEGEGMADFTLRVWERCASSVIEPPRGGSERDHAGT